MATSKAVSVECPHCSKKVIVPPEFRKKGPGGAFLMLSIALLILGGGGYYVIITQRAIADKKARLAAERRERIEAEEALLAKKAKEWVDVLNSTREETLKTENDFKRALSALQVFQDKYPKEMGYTSVLKEKILRLKSEAAQRTVKSLKKQFSPLIDAGKFAEAAAIYNEYNGEFSNDTNDIRAELAKECHQKAEERSRANAEKERLAKKNRDILIKEVVGEITKQHYKEALNKLRASNDDSLKKAITALDVLSHISDSVLKSFKGDVGKKTTIKLRQGNLTAKIKKIKDGAVYAEISKKGTKISRRLKLKDLDYSEIAERLKSCDKLAGIFFKGIVAMKKRKYASAQKYFAQTELFAPDLLQYLTSIKEIASENQLFKKKLIKH